MVIFQQKSGPSVCCRCSLTKTRTQTHLLPSLFGPNTHGLNTRNSQQCALLCLSQIPAGRVSCRQLCRPNRRWHNYSWRRRNIVNRGETVCSCMGSRWQTFKSKQANTQATLYALRPSSQCRRATVCSTQPPQSVDKRLGRFDRIPWLTLIIQVTGVTRLTLHVCVVGGQCGKAKETNTAAVSWSVQPEVWMWFTVDCICVCVFLYGNMWQKLSRELHTFGSWFFLWWHLKVEYGKLFLKGICFKK